MFSSVTSGAVGGIASYLMQVEVDVTDGLPSFNMVGFMSGDVREAGERVKVALKNAGTKIPPSKITINLSPADIRKTGVVVDLPIAVGIMAAMGEIGMDALKDVFVLGELGLAQSIFALPPFMSLVGCTFLVASLVQSSSNLFLVAIDLEFIG